MKTNNEIQNRSFDIQSLRVLQTSQKQPIIQGYAAVFGMFSQDLGGFREIIRPGAFTKTIQNDDVAALWNHDSNIPLGRVRNKTLRLAEDQKGLAFEFEPPDTQWGRDAVVSIRRGDVYQMSFAFKTVKDSWINEGGSQIRELVEVRLYDVSPVTYPAYPQTSAGVAMRGLKFSSSSKKTIAEMKLELLRLEKYF